MGERLIKCVTTEGKAMPMPMQVTDVHKVMVDVSKLAKKGNRVVVDEEGSVGEIGTGARVATSH